MDTAQLHTTLADRIAAVIEGDRGWDAPSPCEGWTAADVLDHLVTTQRDLLARHHVDLPEVASGSPDARWRAHTDAVSAAMSRPEVDGLAFDGFFGPTTVGQTYRDVYAFDMVVHRWDLARALGRDADLTDDELDLVERSLGLFGEHIRMAGICAAPVTPPRGATRAQRLIAATGRDPR